LEKLIIHTKFVVGNPKWKIQLGRFKRGWSVKEGQYENLELRVTNFIVLSQKIERFCSVNSSPTAQSNKLFVFNEFQNLSYMYEVTSMSLLSLGTLLLLM
jgi:hypothetical protein